MKTPLKKIQANTEPTVHPHTTSFQPGECRFLCSELVNVLYEDGFGNILSTTANLEDISADSATLLLEAKLKVGTPVSFCAKGHDLYGNVESIDVDEVLGWYTRIKLDRCSRWCGRWFVPEHFLPLSSLL